jgi:hypothetical protein
MRVPCSEPDVHDGEGQVLYSFACMDAELFALVVSIPPGFGRKRPS